MSDPTPHAGRYQLFPPAAGALRDALKADILAHGVRDAITVDEAGAILQATPGGRWSRSYAQRVRSSLIHRCASSAG